LNKAFIAQVGEERGQQQWAILHKLDPMDMKFEAVYKVGFDLDIIVCNPQDNEKDHLSSS